MENTLFLMCPIVDILLKMYAHQERGLVFFLKVFSGYRMDPPYKISFLTYFPCCSLHKEIQLYQF